jgi:hypothetical protein
MKDRAAMKLTPQSLMMSGANQALRMSPIALAARQALVGVLGVTLSMAGMMGVATAQSAASSATQSQPTATAAKTARAVPLEQLGGQIWFAEDPALLEPSLSVSATDKVTWANGKFGETVKFTIYTNYAAFIKRSELRIYGPGDTDRVRPIAVLPVVIKPGSNQVSVDWSGETSEKKQALRLNIDDRLQYVMRVYDEQDRWDETRPGVIRVVSDAEKTRALETLRQTVSLGTQQESQLSGLSLQNFALAQTNFGNNNLLTQNIVLTGSRVRIRGQSIPDGTQIKINGENIPVDSERKFVAEYLLPIGSHRFAVEATRPGASSPMVSDLQVNVTGKYWFMVGLADFTVSQNSYSGRMEAVAPEDYERFGGTHTDGRMAFYLKGKIQGRYLLTAHADTLERDVKEMFKRLFKADKTDIMRRIDPDAYYAIYGDDSITTRDVDTSGRVYVRLDWDKSSATWGNVRTNFDGTTLSTYDRSLYGAKLAYRSPSTTELGEPLSQAKVFAAEQQTSPGKSEYWGTGGSLYYMRHSDLVPGTQKVELQVRDKDSDRILKKYELRAGRDYEINSFQGRIILSRPLQQIVRDNNPVQDQPGGGDYNVLSVTYDYYPSGLQQENLSAGLSLKQWLGGYVALGATYVRDERAGQDYELKGVDVTLQKGVGTYVKVERAESKASQGAVYQSRDGGLSFTPLVAQSADALGQVKGTATSVEARINTQELGLTERPWKGSVWAKETDAGFSSGHTTNAGIAVRDTGVEVTGQVTENLEVIVGRKNVQSQGVDETEVTELDRTRMGLQWRPTEKVLVNAEAQLVNEEKGSSLSKAGLMGLRVSYRVFDRWDVYGGLQKSFSHVNYAPNDAYTLGSTYLFENESSLGLEYTDGDRGSALTATGEYRRTKDHTIYTSYTYAPDTSVMGSGDSLIASRVFSKNAGWTLGQRWQLDQQWRLNQESQWVTDGRKTGQLNTLGLDFVPSAGWTTGVSVQKGELTARSLGEDRVSNNAVTDRTAVSLNAGFSDATTQWASKLEQRQDTSTDSAAGPGETRQQQLLTTNRFTQKVSEDLRVLGKLNYSITKTTLENAVATDQTDAKLLDTSIGLAWRPAEGKLNLLGKFNYVYDLGPVEQTGSASAFDQKSKIFSLEGTYTLSRYWEFAAKVARRNTQTRLERGQGLWFSNDATYVAGQARIKLDGLWEDRANVNKWDDWGVTVEYRHLSTERDGVKKGALISLDKDLSENFRFGIGYNFTDFSADLTDLSYRHKGWFLNFLARY